MNLKIGGVIIFNGLKMTIDKINKKRLFVFILIQQIN